MLRPQLGRVRVDRTLLVLLGAQALLVLLAPALGVDRSTNNSTTPTLSVIVLSLVAIRPRSV